VISERCLALIREFEGLRLEAYPDPASGGEPWTLGFGHTKGVKRGDTCTPEQAEAWLREDAAEAEAQVLSTTQLLNRNQLDAVVSFVFNLGITKFRKSTMLQKISAGDFVGAAAEFKRWNLGGGKAMPGLVRRRAAEAALFAGSPTTNHDEPAQEPPYGPQATYIANGGSLYANDERVNTPDMPKTLQNPSTSRQATEHSQQEAPVAPFVAAGLAALIQNAPALIRVFGDSPQAEKNAQAAEMVAEIAKAATGEATVEGAVNAIQTDPEKAAAYREQIHLSMSDLVSLAERVNAMDQKNIAAAREYNAGDPLFLDWPCVKLKFIHVLSLLFVSFSGAFVWAKWDALTPELKGAVITLMVIAGWNGVRDYWMGSSSGSERKTAMLAEK
jgi:lysozyme